MHNFSFLPFLASFESISLSLLNPTDSRSVLICHIRCFSNFKTAGEENSPWNLQGPRALCGSSCALPASPAGVGLLAGAVPARSDGCSCTERGVRAAEIPAARAGGRGERLCLGGFLPSPAALPPCAPPLLVEVVPGFSVP